MVIVAIWSPGLDTARFFAPLLPIALFCLMDRIMTAKEDAAFLPDYYKTLARPLWLISVMALLSGIFLVGIPQTTRLIRGSYCNDEALFRCYEESGNWIKKNTEKGDVIASHLDPLVYLLSGKQAINVAWGNITAPLQDP